MNALAQAIERALDDAFDGGPQDWSMSTTPEVAEKVAAAVEAHLTSDPVWDFAAAQIGRSPIKAIYERAHDLAIVAIKAALVAPASGGEQR